MNTAFNKYLLRRIYTIAKFIVSSQILMLLLILLVAFLIKQKITLIFLYAIYIIFLNCFSASIFFMHTKLQASTITKRFFFSELIKILLLFISLLIFKSTWQKSPNLLLSFLLIYLLMQCANIIGYVLIIKQDYIKNIN